jgi:BirA family biotin operon repressor/biotin-[acetyl-CoA-carboxylase] ligase
MLFHNRAIIRLESVDSTNNYAANLVRLSLPPEGTVITAQEQTAGKGQRGSSWESALGENLLCSIILYPNFLNSNNHFYLIKAVALALRDLAEEQTEQEVYIKWPNDIMVNNKKIAGILMEAVWSDQKIQSAVVGIGFNVNQTQFEYNKATSIKLCTKRNADVEQCLEAYLVILEKYLLKLMSGQYSEISRLYRESLYRLGQVCNFLYQGKSINAMITGVDENGQLRLYTEGGEGLSCGIKEIQFVL